MTSRKSVLNMLPAEELHEFNMHLEGHRIKSFSDWPFKENCLCTPTKMAAAGFYHCPTDQEPDCVKCFVCFKELDGWEPDDDPWQEHLSHASKCPFLKLKKSVENLTMHEFLKLQTVIQKNKAQMMLKTEFALFDKQVEAVKNEMLRLI